MHARARTIALIASTAAPAAADIASTNSTLWDGLSTAFEARVRLDNGNSQTWKSAFWQGSTLLSTSGNTQNLFTDGIPNAFNFNYDTDTGFATLDVAGRSVTDTINLSADKSLAGIAIALRSESGVGVTTATNLMASIDGGSAIALPSYTTGINSQTYLAGDPLFFDAQVSTFSLSGDVNFDWDVGNLQGDRFRMSVYLIEGELQPSAPTTAAFLFAGMLATRRRR